MTEAEFAVIKKRLRTMIGIDLECYKSPQMQRRLDGYLGRVHATSWAEYLHSLESDPQARDQLRDFITINVSSFFRDRKKWEELDSVIMPQMLRRGHELKAWSAACSHGAEAFSLAMLFQEYPGVTRYQILATDVDATVLKQASAGGPYSTDDVREVPAQLLALHFRHDAQGYWVQPRIRQHVRFAEQDLLRATATAEFDLVICRNVLIYFTEAAKVQVLRSLVRALVPGGFLFIGATESIPNGQVAGLERVGFSFYHRVDS